MTSQLGIHFGRLTISLSVVFNKHLNATVPSGPFQRDPHYLDTSVTNVIVEPTIKSNIIPLMTPTESFHLPKSLGRRCDQHGKCETLQKLLLLHYSIYDLCI